MTRIITIAILVTAATALSQAYPVSYPTGTVKEIQAWHDGSVHVSLNGNSTLCPGVSTEFASIYVGRPSGRDADAVRNQLSMLNAAKLAGRTVLLATQREAATGHCLVLNVALP